MVAVAYERSDSGSGRNSGAGPDVPVFATLEYPEHRDNVGNQDYKVVCLNTFADLETIRTDWEALFAESLAPYSYFQSYDWCSKWVSQFAGKDGAEIQVYAVFRADSLVAVWPFAVNEPNAKLRVLTTLGYPLSQYSSLVVDEACFDLWAGRKLFGYIKANSRCDTIHLPFCADGSLIAKIVEDEGIIEEPRLKSALLNLEKISDWDVYHAELPSKQRKDRNKRRNKLQKLGKLEYQVVPAGTPEYRQLVDTCLDFKCVWLKETGRKTGHLGSLETASFFKSLEAVVKNGKLEYGAVAHSLNLDGKPVGIEIGMICNNDYYSYLGGMDWNLKRYSPGKVQMENAQRWAKEEGLSKFDFLNDPSDYKAYWTDEEQPLVSVNVPLSIKGQFHAKIWMAMIRPRLKLFYHKSGARTRVFFNMFSTLIGSKR